MYSRNLSGRNNDERYRTNIPPKYSGSRFSQNTQNADNQAQMQPEERGGAESENSLYLKRRSDVKTDIPVKVTLESGLPEISFPDEILDEDEVISLPDFEFLSNRLTDNARPEQSLETVSYQTDGQFQHNEELTEEFGAEDERKKESSEKEKLEEQSKPVSKRGFLSNIFGGERGLKGEKNGFSYEDLLLGGLILLISSSETTDNEDILILLALLLAYRD